MTQESKLLIGALRRAVVGTTEELSLSLDWQQLLRLAQMHMLLPLLYDGLRRYPEDWEQVPEPAKKLLHSPFCRQSIRIPRWKLSDRSFGKS